ncbi:MAG: hypothetical protein RL095_2226 [Verrucomicrobiota bacterium]|jgi:membrane protease subunit (stomatin/prohibitin family)
MGLWDNIKSQFIDIIEWNPKEEEKDTVAYRFPRYQNEIKNEAQLIVREGQVAIFVREGQLADAFLPGRHTLSTSNLPILSTLAGWKYGFNSPFVAEVYFIRTTQILQQKWGTRNPVTLRCPELGPVRLRAFGTFAYRVTEAKAFLKEVIGTDTEIDGEQIAGQLRDIIIARFTNKLATLNVPVLDLAANQDAMAKTLSSSLDSEFKEYGVSVTKFLVENIALPPEVEKVLDKRSSMSLAGNLDQYTKFQAAESISLAAANPGGAAGAGIGIGAGVAMGQQMMGAMQSGFAAPAQVGPPPAFGATPPPLPAAAVAWHVAVAGQTYGPYTGEQVRDAIRAGQINASTSVWRAGLAAWSPAANTELASLFSAPPSAVPPPPPPG